MGFVRDMSQEAAAGFRQVVADDLAVLSRLFASEMDRPMMEWLRISRFPTGIAIGAEGDEGASVLRRMTHAIALLPQVGEREAREALSRDFARLIHSPALPETACESHWTKDGCSSEIVRLYESHGFDLRDRSQRPADFLAYELGFLAHLLEDSKLPGGICGALAAEFLDQHLLKWVPDFLDEMAKRARTEFYGALAALLGLYLARLFSSLGHVEGDILSVRA